MIAILHSINSAAFPLFHFNEIGSSFVKQVLSELLSFIMAVSHFWDYWSTTHVLVTSSTFLLLYFIATALHRLFFSQYAIFPGPKLAGLTYGYMFYYDAIVGKGQYYKKIEKLHEEYGAFHSSVSSNSLGKHISRY